MRDEQNQMVAGDLTEQIHDKDGVRLVKVSRRLVGKDDARILDNGARNGNALLLTARERVRRAVLKALHADICERGVHAFPHFPAVFHPAQAQGVCNVVVAGDIAAEVVVLEDVAHFAVAQGVGVLADVLTVHGQTAAGKAIQTADDVEQRGFAAPALAENGNHAPLGQVKADVVDDVNFVLLAFVEKFVQMLDADHSAFPPFRAFLTL